MTLAIEIVHGYSSLAGKLEHHLWREAWFTLKGFNTDGVREQPATPHFLRPEWTITVPLIACFSPPVGLCATPAHRETGYRSRALDSTIRRVVEQITQRITASDLDNITAHTQRLSPHRCFELGKPAKPRLAQFPMQQSRLTIWCKRCKRCKRGTVRNCVLVGSLLQSLQSWQQDGRGYDKQIGGCPAE